MNTFTLYIQKENVNEQTNVKKEERCDSRNFLCMIWGECELLIPKYQGG